MAGAFGWACCAQQEEVAEVVESGPAQLATAETSAAKVVKATTIVEPNAETQVDVAAGPTLLTGAAQRKPGQKDAAEDKEPQPEDAPSTEPVAPQGGPFVFTVMLTGRRKEVAATGRSKASASTQQLSMVREDLGLSLDAIGQSHVLVDEVGEGMISYWNSQQPGKTKVCANDRIVNVNGAKGDAWQLVQKLAMDPPPLRLQVERFEEYEITVDLADDKQLEDGTTVQEKRPLGLGLQFQEGCNTLIVTEVKPGVAKDWNDKYPQCQVKVGHRIVEVNTVRGQPQLLLEMLRVFSKLNLKLLLA